jgi:hypothetical protein
MIQIPKVSPLFKRGLGGFFGNWNLDIICYLFFLVLVIFLLRDSNMFPYPTQLI